MNVQCDENLFVSEAGAKNHSRTLSAMRLVLHGVIIALLGVGLIPFSPSSSLAWDPSVEPVLDDGQYYIRPYLQASDGSWYEGTYSIGINDHGAAYHNDAITYSSDNPVKLEKTSKKNKHGRTTYILKDDGGWIGAFRRFTNSKGGGTGNRLVGCASTQDRDGAEYFAFETAGQLSPNSYIVALWEGAVEIGPHKVGLEEGNRNSKDCHLVNIADANTFFWVITKK